ncbi:MAG: Gfo/Idh/MocA family oxidoreductase [Chloroflexota bacterium]
MTKLRLGILSTARIAERRVVPAIQNSLNAVVSAVASRDETRARDFAARHTIPKAFGSYETLLADAEINAVYIPLPNSMHGEWTLKAAQAGKHVLCEKPFAANASEVDTMIAACAVNNVVLMEAFMYRFHPQTVKVIELVRGGAIGAVKLVRAAFCFPVAQETNIRLNAALAGGSLMDVGTYCVNAARTIIEAEPQSVVALAQFGAASKVDEAMAGALQFANGALATFDCGFRSAYRQHYEIIGERGRIEAPKPFITNNTETHILLHHPDDRVETFTFPPVDQYTLMAEHFADCVLRGQPLRYPASEGRAQMRTLDALYESAKTGKAVSV